MNGFSLLEFLLGMTLFVFILIYGYSAFEGQTKLIAETTVRTRSEEESNYRLLVLKNLLQDAVVPFHRDWRLAEIPIFFSDLDFGKTTRADAFSVARSQGPPLEFILNGGWIEMSQPFSFARDDLIALTGTTASNTFDWNYARVIDVASKQKIKVSDQLARTSVISGCLMKVEIDGFVFRNRYLYSVSASGQNQPFFGPLDSFTYGWQNPQLIISWKAGLLSSNFRATL